ncbi:hypothetical protein [Streptomyces reniochalinae]|uniref:Protein kilB n=1 Tax=Streptomyces reniochalinae TaxID=2250578 RepID=A0A367EJN0_9ACTN|nr:hypothetical protein [Streptomyces reniochalinae]RCG18173.1 hypothetical protein DQ392_14600 [Streptomyces reniochalinae]
MEWISPVSTAIGALIGVGSTLVVDRARWRRERTDRAQEQRLHLYADYSASLSRMRTALNECAQEEAQGEDRAQRVRALFLSPGGYELRHQLAILAPQAVIEASRTAFIILRETRDCLLAGADAHSTDYRELEDSFDNAIAELRALMRRDLGAPDSIPGQAGY